MMKKAFFGFTLIEVLAVISILLVIGGIATISLVLVNRNANLNSSVDLITADLRQQQLKAMTGDTEGRSASDNYGLYFSTNNYVLFHSSYSQSESSNFKVNLGDNLEFVNVTLPGSQIIFGRGSGDVVGFTNGSNTFTLRDKTNNNQKTITINRYGAVISIN